MICPNCGSFWPGEDRFCSNCGTPLYSDAAPAAKKGRRWVPILVMVVMAVLGTIAYFAIRLPDSGLPASTEAPWFTMDGTTLVDFDPAAYIGPSDLVVPETIDGVPVLAIGDSCFYGCTELTSVTLPAGVTSIGEFAFAKCSSLRGMHFPQAVTAIGPYAFYGCTDLEAVCIYNGVQTIGEGAFAQCDSLIYVLYNGPIAQWQALYDGYINPFTYIYCGEGVYPQGIGSE